MRRGLHRSARGLQPRGRWALAALALLLVVASVGSVNGATPNGGPSAAATGGAPGDVSSVDLSGGR